MATPAASTTDHGYLYDLLRKLGLTDFGARTGEFLLVKPVRVFAIVVGCWIAGRILTRLIRRFVHTLHRRAPVGRLSPRAAQRTATVADALASLMRVAVWGVGSLMILSELGINLAPLLAGAGIAGIAVGFGAQSLVKDYLSGFFILVEDQCGVGDVVTLGNDVTGTVEDISLRVMRVRSTDGTVWFVPNSEIHRIGNTSMEWSRALIDVLVAYENDLEQVSKIIQDEANAFAEDPKWSEDILEPPEVWGVQSMTPDGAAIRLVVKTAPRRQYAVARELRGRIGNSLRKAGVKGPGQTVVVTAGALDQGTPPPAPPDK
jgi:moderate conductance mechanosensitive channel